MKNTIDELWHIYHIFLPCLQLENYFAAYFTRTLSDTKCQEGQSFMSFVCEVVENIVPGQWSKEDTEIVKSDKYSIEITGKQHKLTIYNIDQGDASKYSIKVNSRLRHAFLHVTRK